MSVSWTTEQQQVIDLRDRNILVSAAAGSGKTAVLVERILKRLTDSVRPVDVDHLLVAPKCLQNKVLAMIDAEIEHTKAGEPSYIGLKMNS